MKTLYSFTATAWSGWVLSRLESVCAGSAPLGMSHFYAEDTQQMYKNICFGKIRFPRGVINEDGKQFVKGVSLPRCPLRPRIGY
jgi:hypothetical protein